MLKSKKGGISIAVTLIVFLTLALVLSSLFYFITRKGGLEAEVGNYLVVKNLNVRSEIVNFNIQQIVDRSYVFGNTKEEFIENFNEELGRYKINNKYLILELGQLENQLGDNILITDVGVEATFNVELSGERKNNIRINHKYEKTFINE